MHNNYLTLPVLLTMLAGHFPFAYGADHAWLVLVALMLLGAWARLFFNLRHRGGRTGGCRSRAPLAFVALAVGVERRRSAAAAPPAPRARRGGQAGRSPPPAARACHTLADAGATGDGRPRPRRGAAVRRPRRRAREERAGRDAVVRRAAVEDEIAAVAAYVAGRRAELGSRPMLRITAGGFEFAARLEEEAAPATVAAFRRLLPLESRIIHVRWSGEAGWIPFGDLDLGLGPENATSYPHPGELVLYPGGVSETEILLAYGYVNFASKAGQLAGNHFATVVEGRREPPAARREVPLGGRAGDRLRGSVTPITLGARARATSSCARATSQGAIPFDLKTTMSRSD